METSKRTRAESLRTVIGFVVVPPTAALISLPVYMVMFATGLLRQGAPIESIDSLLGFASGVAFLAIFVMVFCALPAVSWLSDRRALSFERVLALGAALGNVPFTLIVVVLVAVELVNGRPFLDVGHYWYGAAGAVARVVMGGVVGAGSAAVFWFVAIENNASWQTD